LRVQKPGGAISFATAFALADRRREAPEPARSHLAFTPRKDYYRLVQNLLELMALVSAGLFAGAALYITAVAHPVRMSQGASGPLQEFRASYELAAPKQAGLAVICFLCSLVVWRLTGRWEWLAGGSLVGAVVPLTLLVILPTNRLLLDANLSLNEDETRRLLGKWGQLHALRSWLSLAGFIVLAGEALRRR